jgi:ABC-type transport system involved in multi-copper enzyme maturation permease subunit
MSVTTTDSRAMPVGPAAAGRYGVADLARSEWTKLRTVRSSIWTVGTTILIGLAASGIATGVTRAHWATMSASNRASFHPVEVSLMGAFLGGTLLLGILGILVMSSEYATGTIRATLAVAPRRPMVLAAKVLVFGTVSLIVAEFVAFASFLAGQAFLTSPAPHATLSSPGTLRAVAGLGLFLCVVGLLALGIAVLVRHTAGAISAYVGVILVLPIIVSAVPGSLQYQIERVLPLEIGSAMINNPAPDAFGPWAGFLILCGYTVLVLALGTVMLVRRDA